MIDTHALLAKRCQHQTDAIDAAQLPEYLAAVDGWQLADDAIVKTFSFADYHQTIAFVNAIADVIHTEDHHPQLTVSYNRCTVQFNTHSVNAGRGGLSENDFICAAKLDAVFAQARN